MKKMLLFIKSIRGSHNPNENTTKIDMEKGDQASVLVGQNENKEKCEVKMDVRMQTSTNAEEVFEEISDMIIGICHETGSNYMCKKTDKAIPVKTSTKMIKQVQAVCEERKIKNTIMPSWAGHDIAHLSIMKKILLFIKSTGGSHNPNENTTKYDMEKGIQVLEGSVEEDIMQVHEIFEKVKKEILQSKSTELEI